MDEQASVEEMSAGRAADPRWTAAEVHQAMESLSAHHREALTLFFLEDLSVSEMAQVLRASEGTVKSRLFYAKRALRRVPEKSGSQT